MAGGAPAAGTAGRRRRARPARECSGPSDSVGSAPSTRRPGLESRRTPPMGSSSLASEPTSSMVAGSRSTPSGGFGTAKPAEIRPSNTSCTDRSMWSGSSPSENVRHASARLRCLVPAPPRPRDRPASRQTSTARRFRCQPPLNAGRWSAEDARGGLGDDVGLAPCGVVAGEAAGPLRQILAHGHDHGEPVLVVAPN